MKTPFPAAIEQSEMPGSHSWRIGDLKLTSILESQLPVLDINELFPDLDESVLEKHMPWLAPRFYDPATRRLTIAIQGFLIESHGKRILVDTCVGDCKSRVRAEFNEQQRGWLDRLCAVGFHPDSIDIVICTHLHVDHVGWNTQFKNGRWIPTFPNARYLFTRTDFEYWSSRSGQLALNRTGDYIHDSVLPLIEQGRADLVEVDHRINASVCLAPAGGHSPGMVCVELTSEGQQAVLTSDLLHTPLQCCEPQLSTRFCCDPDTSRMTRGHWLSRLADTQALVIPSHFPAPSAGHIRRRGDAFDFQYLND